MLLKIKELYFSYSKNKPIFQNLNLEIEQGKIVALAGESGCGKSTLLNLIYGLLNWEKGEIFLEEIPLFGPKANLVPGESNMKFVAQNYDLMPFSTVYDNVGKFISNIHLEEKRQQVLELLEVVEMVDFADVLPKNLSGGQQQRVAIARALSLTPKLLLLDEPFSNLDFSRKIQLREKLFAYAKQKNLSIIISTHEIQEIMPWLDQIVVLKDGKLIQKDTPEETYKNPYNDYVAKLFGEVNIFSDEESLAFNLHKKFWFPREILISEEGEMAEVLESRFSGDHYWNKIKFKDKILTIYTDTKIVNPIKIVFKSQ